MREWQILKFMIAILITGSLSGCGTIPNVTFSYYPAKWNTVATVTQTVGCNAAKTRIVVLNTLSVTTTYSSNFNKEPFKIIIKDLESAFADSDMTITFTDDGRLKSINQSTTGQGETIVKSAVALVTAAVPIAMKLKVTPIEECKTIDDWGNGKPVTLNYTAIIDSTKLGNNDVPFDVAWESKELYRRLQGQLPKLKVRVSDASVSQSGPNYDTSPSDNVVLLELQKIGFVDLTISANDATIGTASIVIPETETYKLPIPKAALFGKQTFAITLSEAGAVTSVGYGKNAGTAGAMNALGAIVNVESPAAKAADLKAQADLIAQQQRLVLCQTKPDQCK